MKKLVTITLLLVLSLNLGGCSSRLPTSHPTPPANMDQKDALQALVDFFKLLHAGEYQAGADLYAGSYEWLMGNNPDISPSDPGALLERGCRQNGLMCLAVLTAEPLPSTSPAEYIFQVEFKMEDGSLFVLGPCCGATVTEMPPVSQFQYQVVQREDGSWGVTDLPPYVP